MIKKIFSTLLVLSLVVIFPSCKTILKVENVTSSEITTGVETVAETTEILKEVDETQKYIDYFIENYSVPSVIQHMDKVQLKSLYYDITGATIKWGTELKDYLNLIFSNYTQFYYEENEQKVIRYLGDKEAVFRELFLYYKPFDNVENLDDIDKDGIPYDRDAYPFNYTNGETYFVLTKTYSGEEGMDPPDTLLENILKKPLINNLNYNSNNIYLYQPCSVKQFEGAIKEILSKTTKNDIIFILESQHGNNIGDIGFVDKKGNLEIYPISNMRRLFDGKEYGTLILLLSNCYGGKYLLDINKSVIVAEGKGQVGGIIPNVLKEQIEKYDLNFNDFIETLEENSLGEPQIKVTAPLLQQDQKDWSVINAYYKK